QTFDVTVIQSGWDAASDERAALEALYASAGGPGWTCSENWCGDKPLDEWYGVQTDDEGHVISLSLCDNNLRGTLPGELVALSRLRRLDLSRNALSGTVLNANDGTIDYLHLLSELESVDLSRNNFEGRLPAAWCDMPNLKFLDVSSNRLSGGINYKWGAMFEGGRYVDLVLNGNYLSSPVPAAMQNHYLWGKLALQIMRQYGYFEGGEISGIGLDYDKDVYMPDFTFIDLATAAPRSIRDLYSANKLTMLLHWNPLQEESCDFAETVVRRYHTLFGKDGFAVLALIPEGEEYSDAALRYLREHDAGWSAAAEYFDTEGNRPVLPCEPFPSYQLMDTYGKVTLDMYDGKYGALSMADNWLVEMSSFAHMEYLNILLIKTFGYRGSSYESIDYDKDKRYETIQRATKGKGIDVIFIGEAFTDIDIETGYYEEIMKQAVDAYFMIEPTKSYRDYFNIYVVYAVSKKPYVGSDSEYSQTALGIRNVPRSQISGDYDVYQALRVLPEYCRSCPLQPKAEYFPVVIVNGTNGGMTYDQSAAMGPNCPVTGYVSRNSFLGVLIHESVGHAFGLLGDEYVDYVNGAPLDGGTISEARKRILEGEHKKGWSLNLSLTSDFQLVPWTHLIGHPRYPYVGTWEGGYYYAKGVWRSEATSIMNDSGNCYYFNAVCRELIVKRILTLAGEEYSFEKFLANDSDEGRPGKGPSRLNHMTRHNTEYKHCPPVLME
ncbi:MAG: hypothetical protein K2J51_02400, partial [Alistipes sp.]|nr:hypothetical protein [Alistipes sp.]